MDKLYGFDNSRVKFKSLGENLTFVSNISNYQFYGKK